MKSLYGNLKDVIILTWPTLVIAMITYIFLRTAYLIKNKNKFYLYKEILLFIFVFYIICFFQVVTCQDINTSGANNFVPFTEMFRYKIGSRLFIKNIIGNLLLFIPYGFFISYYMNTKHKIIDITLILLASLSIELTQLAIGRVFDVDDIILNTFGGIIGTFGYIILNKIYIKLPKFTKTLLFKNIISIIIFIIFEFVIIRIMYI